MKRRSQDHHRGKEQSRIRKIIRARLKRNDEQMDLRDGGKKESRPTTGK